MYRPVDQTPSKRPRLHVGDAELRLADRTAIRYGSAPRSKHHRPRPRGQR